MERVGEVGRLGEGLGLRAWGIWGVRVAGWAGLVGRGPVGPVACWAGAPRGFAFLFFISFFLLFIFFNVFI